jgi:hypothetical protein
MSKSEKKFNSQMQQSLLKLYAKGEITAYSLQVAQGSVRYSYISKLQKGPYNELAQPS